MSHLRVKTEYIEIGAYGVPEKHTLYAHHNLSCDVTTYYDEKGNYIMSVEDTERNNLLDAINRLSAPYENDGKLNSEVVLMTPEEQKLCEK